MFPVAIGQGLDLYLCPVDPFAMIAFVLSIESIGFFGLVYLVPNVQKTAPCDYQVFPGYQPIFFSFCHAFRFVLFKLPLLGRSIQFFKSYVHMLPDGENLAYDVL